MASDESNLLTPARTALRRRVLGWCDAVDEAARWWFDVASSRRLRVDLADAASRAREAMVELAFSRCMALGQHLFGPEPVVVELMRVGELDVALDALGGDEGLWERSVIHEDDVSFRLASCELPNFESLAPIVRAVVAADHGGSRELACVLSVSNRDGTVVLQPYDDRGAWVVCANQAKASVVLDGFDRH